MRIAKPMMDRNGGDDPARGMAYEYRRVIGDMVRDLRLEAEMTQRELGELLDIGETGISALELGRSSVSPERYGKIAEIFALDVKDWGKLLLRYTDPYLYSLLFGVDDDKLKSDLEALSSRTRVNRTRGPRH